MSLFAPVTETVRGFKGFLVGYRWLKAHPKQLSILFVPMVIGLLGLIIGLNLFVSWDQEILNWILFTKPEEWYWLVLYYISYVLLYIAAIVAVPLFSILLMNVVASPFYEYVSQAIERERTGKVGEEMSFLDNLRIMLVELKKVAFIVIITILMMFVPVLNVVSTLIAAFLVGWDFFDYPMARRNWGFRQRLGFVLNNFWSVMGFGLWLVIPVVNFIFVPLAVAGGTILNLEALDKRT
jgi:CysZ protein